jgi:acetamidase/formamidase
LVTHQLDSLAVHYDWDNATPPRLRVESGDTVVLETRSGDDDYFLKSSMHDDVVRRPAWRGHALTGPVYVSGAEPGDVLQVDVLSVEPWDWGYTFIRAGAGLLEDELAGPYFKSWDMSNRRVAVLRPGIEVPLDPFLGVMGTARAEPGQFATGPPTRTGGNVDTKQLTAGSTLWLPVEVSGALFSAGDAHGAQGDGEACGTAIETGSRSVLRLSVVQDLRIQAPEFRTARLIAPDTNAGPWYGTMGIGPDLMEASRDAVRAMIAYLGREWQLSPEDAYVLCSVAADLRISEVVDKPNWVVSALFPLTVFHDRSSDTALKPALNGPGLP